MKKWKLGLGSLAAVWLLGTLTCTAFGAAGPGEFLAAADGGVVRKDSASAAETVPAVSETVPAGTEAAPGAAEAVPGENVPAESQEPAPGVPLESVTGLTYDIRNVKAAQDESVEQMIVIAGHDGSYARVTMYQKVPNTADPAGYEWRVLVDAEGRMGRNGMGKEKEGDEKTPVGLYTAGLVFGNKSNPGTSLPYIDVTPTMYWVGDSSSPYYNKLADTAAVGDVFDKPSSEHLSAYGAVYNYCVDMGYNPEGTPYKGSALFLHCTNGYGTAGCVAIPEEDMANVVRYLKAGAKFLLDEAGKIEDY